MKPIILLTLLSLTFWSSFSQNKMLVHTMNSTDEYWVEETDYMFFDDNSEIIYFQLTDDLISYYVSDIDSITFDVTSDNTVYVIYSDQTVNVINPLEGLGVSVEVDGADVIVTSETETKDINYVLSGSTTEGMFKIYSLKRFNLLLDGVEIVNSDWPAINIQSEKKCRVNLVYGTENSLIDGEYYAPPAINNSGEEEDQKATFFSEGDLEFLGGGHLTVNSYGADQSAIRSDAEIQINEGSITITTAEKDGIHGKNGFFMYGGYVNVQSSNGDGIDAGNNVFEMTDGVLNISSSEDDVKAIKSDTSMYLLGGSINIDLSGNQSKAISADDDMQIANVEVHIETSGGVVLEPSGLGYDPSYCTAIDCGTDVFLSDALVIIESNGEAGRGFSVDGNLSIENSEIHITNTGDGALYQNEYGDDDAYHGACFKIDGNMCITSGEIELSNSGDGGKGISVDSILIIGDGSENPILNVTTTGQRIVISQGGGGPGGGSGDYDESKAITVDNEVHINSGEIVIVSADDGIKADVGITINNGNLQILECIEALEAAYITVNDGNIELHSDDDGFNATFGNGGEGNDGSLLQINGGYSMVDASGGDAIDSNGDFELNGGIMVIHGPQSSPEVGMDVNGTKNINNGFLVVSGTNSNMTEGASNSSDQYSILFRTNQSLSANTIFHIEDSQGNNVLTFAPMRSYYSIVFSSDDLQTGETYTLYTGGSCTGVETNGLYNDGDYVGGSFETTFTINQIASTIWF